jgi:integrase
VERNRVYRAEIHSDRLLRVRDIFVFQCLTGCRIGDLIRLTKDNIHNGVLTYIPGKTAKKEGKPVSVPLHEHAMEIISRYEIPGGKLLPFISQQRYNDFLKELLSMEGINLTRPVQRLNPRTGIEETVPLATIASSHLARRTFIGNLFGKVDRSIIASMSGHGKNSKAFARYYQVQESHKKQAVNYL